MPLSPIIARVSALSHAARRGVLEFGPFRFPVALGRGGLRMLKKEGDGATPLGQWPVRAIYYRPDRMLRLRSALPIAPIRPRDGWCDDPADRNYNRRVRLPYRGGAERLWRDDRLYDLLLVLGHNECPRVKGRGSAIFLHVARPNLEPTEGCVAMKPEHLARLLAALPRGARVIIGLAQCGRRGLR
jgi:L,D-peptidoglycan transpeptidase YkuD (ErfK/YbiS/YcfS/YnhG family)